ncbi:MAG: GNAT family N-acetyltransferase [Caldilineaceae bacterium]
MAQSMIFDPIYSPRLIIRHFQATDLPAFLALRSDPELARYQSWETYNELCAQAFITEMSNAQPGSPGTWFQFAVALRTNNTLIGDMALHIKADDPRLGEIGYTLSRQYQGQGLAGEAVTALLNYLFRELQLHRVSAICDVRNHASIRLLERLGLRREGHTLQAFWNHGEWVDEYLYAILRSEWLQQRTTSDG